MVPSDQVLDELTELAAVEHAMIAEYLQVAYVLGHRLPDPAPGPAGAAIADAAQKILSMAQFVEMKHLKLVNEFLVASGRPTHWPKPSTRGTPVSGRRWTRRTRA
jgi:hypothetical protein